MSKNNTSRFAPISISQNFLTNKQTIYRIIRIAELKKSDHVIEIGAGRGHITRELAKICKSVSTYEVDHKLSERLQTEFKNTNVRVFHQDFLTATLPKGEQYKVFSNIPFNRTTEIVRKLTSSHSSPDEAWLVMEKGAGKRFTGKPCESIVSLSLKPFIDAQIRYYFRREDFHPSPSVDAVLVCLKRKDIPDLPISQRYFYEKFVKKHYNQIIRTSRDISYIQWLCLFRKSYKSKCK